MMVLCMPTIHGLRQSNTGILLDGGLNNFYVNTSGQSRMKVESGGVIAYVKLQADELFHAKQGISMDAAGITFPMEPSNQVPHLDLV